MPMWSIPRSIYRKSKIILVGKVLEMRDLFACLAIRLVVFLLHALVCLYKRLIALVVR